MSGFSKLASVALILFLGQLVDPEATLAACWKCASDQSCAAACQGSPGKNQCAHRRACGSNGTCFNYDCELAGNACTGTSQCAGCSQGIEECGIENASWIVPNGTTPPGRPWLERQGTELRVCRAAGRTERSVSWHSEKGLGGAPSRRPRKPGQNLGKVVPRDPWLSRSLARK